MKWTHEVNDMEKDSLIVDGFVFPSDKEAQIASKEKENIEVIRQGMPQDNPEVMYELYTKLIERNMFQTIVGYSFLHEMRHRLVAEFGYGEEELPTVTLPEKMQYDAVSNMNQKMEESKIQKLLLVKKRMTIVITALAFMVVAMFVIAAVNPNVGYINTENKILNKYAAWQEDLDRREKVIKEKEAQLNIDSEN